MQNICRLFPAKLDFPAATRDVASLAGDETTVRLTAYADGFREIANHSAVRNLWCFGVDAVRLETIARCVGLEALYIEDVSTADLMELSRLPKLGILSVDGATKVESLSFLGRMAKLSQLRLQHLPRVKSLADLRSQQQVEALDVSGSIWTRMKVDSFEPLGEFRDLQILYLTNIAAGDGSLRPLSKLVGLQELHVAGFYKWQEFAALAGALSQTSCTWFEPYVEVGHQRCKSCGGQMVMLTGKGQPTLCVDCSADRVQRHVDRFARAVHDAARAAGTGGTTDGASK